MVNKITTPPTTSELIDKVNELVDNIPTNYVTTDTAQEVTGQKTIVGQTILKASASTRTGVNTVSGFEFQNYEGTFVGRMTSTDSNGLAIHTPSAITLKPFTQANGRLQSYGVYLDNDGLSPTTTGSIYTYNLGTSINPWTNIYLKTTIYAGSSNYAITLPNKAGTMALTSDINNPTITFTQGGTTKGTITLNQSGDQTIDLDAGGGSSYTAGTGIDITSDVISVKYDNSTITVNASSKIQTIGVIDNNSGNALKTWTGTLAQYNAIVTKDNNTLYNITDDNTAVAYQAYTKSEVNSLIEAIYPVGSIYIGTQSTCPLATIISGSTWVKVSEGRVLQGSDSGHIAGSMIAAGLPNHTHSASSNETGAHTHTVGGSDSTTTNPKDGFDLEGNNLFYRTININTSSAGKHSHTITVGNVNNNNIYGNSTTVQPPAYVVNIWERTV